MTTKLSVNLNKVALIRNSRDGNYPKVEDFAALSLQAGAQGITVHPRPDQRHITANDVTNLSRLIQQYRDKTQQQIEFNIEGNPFCDTLGTYPGFMPLVLQTKPEQCTLVPDSNQQKTSDHGFDLFADGEKLLPIIAELKQINCRVSLFMDPNIEQITQAAKIGADRIELYTGPFAAAYSSSEEQGLQAFAKHRAAAEHARALGLGVNAGHDLNLHNLKLYKSLPDLQEVSIGHALTVDALIMGWTTTIEKYLDLLGN